MSATLLPDEIRFVQRMLCSAGCYTGPKNGAWSQAVDAAEAQLKTIADQLAAQFGQFDDRSERCIRTLHPKAQRAAREFLTAVRGAGVDARIISGTRTYAEQDALYRRGRFGDTSPRVTNARAGQSNHNFGIAWDIGIFDAGKYLTTKNALQGSREAQAGFGRMGRRLGHLPRSAALSTGRRREEHRRRPDMLRAGRSVRQT